MTRITLLLGAALALLPACASGDRVSRSDLNQASTVTEGVILELAEVEVEGKRTGKGTFFGFVLGAALGSNVGSGGGSRVAAAAGGVGGAVAGEAIEEGSTRVRGLEITLRLDTGEVVTVIQPIQDNEHFAVGDHVQLLRRRDGTARVMQ